MTPADKETAKQALQIAIHAERAKSDESKGERSEHGLPVGLNHSANIRRFQELLDRLSALPNKPYETSQS